MVIHVKWVDSGRKAKCAPNPKYPDGMDVNLAHGKLPACYAKLPYPAKGVGVYLLTCDACGFSAAITAAGRPDDPKSCVVPCKGFVNPDDTEERP